MLYAVTAQNIAQVRLSNAAKRELRIVPGATHLFEEQGAMEEVVRLASSWFLKYLARMASPNEGEMFI